MPRTIRRARRRGAPGVLACAFLLLLAGAGAAQVSPAPPDSEHTIEIREGALFKIPIELREWIYVETPRRVLDTGESCEDVLFRDLQYSDFFDVARERLTMNEAERAAAGIKRPRAVASGEVRRQLGRVVLNGQLTDPSTSKVIFRRDYPLGDPPDRWAIHGFADDITLYLTGERGVAQTRIAFVGNATGHKEIYLVDSDGSRVQAATNLKSISVSPRWSTDGTRLAFTTFANGTPELLGLTLRDGRTWTISSRPGMNSAPCWSPDGQRIAASLSFEGNSEIYLLDISGRNPRRLTESSGIDTSPTFSPQGNRIAFTSDRSGEPQIYVMDIDGTNLQRLTFVGQHCDSPDWSPKGDRILFVSLIDRLFDVCSIRPDGSDLRRLTGGDGNYENPRWAPDGRHVVFALRRGESRRLMIMAADGTGIRQLTWSRGDQYNPAWSPPLAAAGD